MKISDYSRRDFLGAMGYGMAALALPGCLRQMTKSQARSKPNIVIIFADDMGYGDPRCYNGQSKIPTPYIDKLAGQGMRFTDAHVAVPVCGPSRKCLFSGLYPQTIDDYGFAA